MAALAIETCGLTKVFQGEIPAVNSFDLRVRTGAVYGLVGPNGAGKTTVMRLLMGLLRPQEGKASILGEDMWRASRELRSRVAYVAQVQPLHNWMTVEEICRYASRLYERWDQTYARALAGKWQLPLRTQIGRLSGGEQRKAALLLAFSARPEVLLLDEPAAGLDLMSRRIVIEEMIELLSQDDRRTVLISTHLLEDLERIVDNIGMMDAGRLMVSSPLDELKSTVKRVQIVFSGDTVPLDLAIPGAFWSEKSGPVLTALTQISNEAQLDSIRHLPNARVQVFHLNLREIFLAFYETGRDSSRFNGQPLSKCNSEKRL
jgi:ABC-2 type transport system ATP-binding protein